MKSCQEEANLVSLLVKSMVALLRYEILAQSKPIYPALIYWHVISIAQHCMIKP